MDRHMGRISYLSLMALLIPFTNATAQEPPRAANAATDAQPRIELSSTAWDFGEVWQGEPVSTDITIKNVGDAPLTIEVKSSCGCTTPTRPKSPLAPGESDTMTISYKTQTRTGKANQKVTLVTNDPQRRSVAIQVKGNVSPVYEIDPKGGFMFGALKTKEPVERSVDIYNRSDQPLKLTVKQGQHLSPFNVRLEEVHEGQHYRLHAQVRPPFDFTRFQQQVFLETNLPRVPEIKVLIYATVPKPVSVFPPKIFYSTLFTKEISYPVRITFQPNYPIRIKGARASHDAIKLEVQEKLDPQGNPRSPHVVNVTMPPGGVIPSDEKPYIEISTDADDPALQTIRIPIKMVTPPQRNKS